MKRGSKATTRLLPTLFCLLSILLVACGGGNGNGNGGSTTTGATKAAANKQIYIIPNAGQSDFGTLDPALETALVDAQAIQLFSTGLVSLNDKLAVQGQLAKSWDISSDGLSYTFHLKSGLKFSDGSPLTSKDVAYSIDRALQPSLKSNASPIYLALVKDSDKLLKGTIKTIIGDSLLTPDDNTITIVTNQKAGYFLEALTYTDSFVVEKSLVDKYGQTKWTDHLTEGGSTGPFVVKEYTHGQRIVFTPNPNYYGTKPQLQEVIFPFYKTADTSYKAYQSNQVSSTVVPTAEIENARKLTKEFHQSPLLAIYYFTMNYLVKPFDNIHIRQAFALAMNKDLLVKSVWKNKYIPTNHIVPQGMPGYNDALTGPDGVKGTTGDVTKAKQLFQQGMQEEGYSSISQLPPITLTYSSEGGNVDIRNEIAVVSQMWQSTLGITIKQNDIDINKLFYTEIPGATNNPKGLQFWQSGWIADYPDPQDWLTLQFDKGVPNNNMNYGQNSTTNATNQVAAQKQMEAADTNVSDQASRLQSYETIEQQLVNDVAWLPAYQGASNTLRKLCVVGRVPNAQDLIPPDDWGAIYISTDANCANATVGQ